MHRYAPAQIATRADGGGDLAACAEGGVERAIGVVAHQREVIGAAVIGSARDQNLAVGLDRDAVANIATRADGGRHDAIATKERRCVVDGRDCDRGCIAGGAEGARTAGSGNDRVLAFAAAGLVPRPEGDRIADRAVQIPKRNQPQLRRRTEQQRQLIGGVVDQSRIDRQPTRSAVEAVLPGSQAGIQPRDRDRFHRRAIRVRNAAIDDQVGHRHAARVGRSFEDQAHARAGSRVQHRRVVDRGDRAIDRCRGGQAAVGKCVGERRRAVIVGGRRESQRSIGIESHAAAGDGDRATD